MNFKLMRKSSNAALVTFHVVDGKDAVVGSINVPHSEVNNLLKHWKSAHTPAAA